MDGANGFIFEILIPSPQQKSAPPEQRTEKRITPLVATQALVHLDSRSKVMEEHFYR